jgi:hypothetical protein
MTNESRDISQADPISTFPDRLEAKITLVPSGEKLGFIVNFRRAAECTSGSAYLVLRSGALSAPPVKAIVQ